MKIVLIFDQGLAGAGGKSNPNVGLNAERGGIGSSLMLQPNFDAIQAEVVATLYCGNAFYREHEEEVVTKLAAMVKKLNPDFAVCGPCFNFADYADMAAKTAERILAKTDVKAIAMMSEENKDVIAAYAGRVPIVKMPKRGGTGLSQSIENLCRLLNAMYSESADREKIQKEVCYE